MNRLEQFRQRVEPVLPGLYRAAYRLTGNRADAEDLVQDTCLTAWEKPLPADNSRPLEHWLLRVLWVWELLGQTGDPILAQPLTDTLLYDADDRVRAVAADNLAAFRADPAVRAALESVAAEATSPDLRLRAQWSALDDVARVSYVSATLFDRELSPEQQMAPVILARTRRPGIAASERRNAEIPALEGEALDAIARITPDLHDQANRRRDTPGVSERIDQVIEAEPDAEVRQAMETMLLRRDWFSPPGSPFQPPTAQ